jgi:NADP-dependent 3-hydroxy acid dehydrogenase YdfG
MNFQNQIVWITGASSGIGRELALEFARKGATVAISARRMDLLELLVKDIESNGGSAKAFHCDVLDSNSI